VTMPADSPGHRSELRRSVSEATARIQEIIDAAERVAEEIRSEAQAEADRYLEGRRREADRLTQERARQLPELGQSVVASARQVQLQAEALAGVLEEAVARIRATVSSAPATTSDPRRRETREPALRQAPESAPREGPEPPPGDGASEGSDASSSQPVRPADPRKEPVPPPEEPILRVTQMAIAGSTRPDIEAALRGEFGITDPEEIVDRILGPPAD
jgi:hypothetical protein